MDGIFRKIVLSCINYRREQRGFYSFNVFVVERNRSLFEEQLSINTSLLILRTVIRLTVREENNLYSGVSSRGWGCGHNPPNIVCIILPRE